VAAFIVTYFFGVVGYLCAYDDTKGNILLNFDPKDSVILLGRIGYGVTLMAAIPMVTVPCRDAFLSLGPQYSAWKYMRSVCPGNVNRHPQEQSATLHENKLCEHTALLRKESDYETASLLKKTFNSSKKQDDVMNDKVSLYVATSIILLFAFFGATFAPGVATVWSICGSGMAFIIAFILPAACYIKIRYQRKGHTYRMVVVSWFLLLASIICAIACTTQTILIFFSEIQK
jgi:amino acid permease